VVEGQHIVSTREVVETQAEQTLLGEILEHTKPSVPRGAETVHYLLYTPFRYNAPYPMGGAAQ
jgi:hypothetical protein